MNLLDILFPKTCVSCHRWGSYLCAECLKFISSKKNQKCPKCNQLSLDGFTHSGCKTALGLDGVYSGFDYIGLVGSMIGLIKYQGVYDLVPTLSEIFISFGQPEFLNIYNHWLFIPVPLHNLRLRSRGFNQSAMIAKSLATYFNYYYSEKIIQRNKYTHQQMKLEKESRESNVKNAFSLWKSGKLDGINCVLIDDVWTTGATMKEACKPLKKAGANSVWGLTIAS